MEGATISFRMRFSTVAWFVLGFAVIAFDESLQPALRNLGRDQSVAKLATTWNELGATFGIVLFLLIGLVLSALRKTDTLARFVACIALAGIAVQVSKHLCGRARPSSLDGITCFFGPLAWLRFDSAIRVDSMPSGHTTAAFAMATALVHSLPRLSPIWYSAAIGVALCRTLTNSHFPSDVILGALLGTLVARYVLNRFDDRAHRKLHHQTNLTIHET